MTEPTPATPAEVIARRMRLQPTEELLTEIDDAIASAESDVEGYLGRPIRPVEVVAHQCWPVPGGWSIPGEHRRIREIVSAVPETVDGVETGTFTVTYTVGIDYLADPDTRPIRRYVQAAAMNDPMLLAWVEGQVDAGTGAIKSISVSTEGQSKNVTYERRSYGGGGAAGQDSPGALPSKSSMDRWRLANRRVHQAPDLGYDARLYTGSGTSGVPYRDRDGFWNLP